ncbi:MULTISPECIES: DUF2158 domain-containing protein [Rhodoplanes]|uniref:DUF2158 domain-containing protein n=1 Tax=Rhodoplanes TaxID=29407 RepID=UPI001FCF1805|nr:DUF2158 domain-containing protein [Rhodoplanes serenus]
MDETEFKPGDLVRVKSGGPIMTVEQVGKTAMLEEDAVRSRGKTRSRRSCWRRLRSHEPRSPSASFGRSVVPHAVSRPVHRHRPL